MSLKFTIRKIAVLGSGVMGSQIAAHCANAGYEVLLLDMKSEGRPNKIAEDNLAKLAKMNPAPFAKAAFAQRVTAGNFEDDFEKLRDCDWICEVIIERMDIKKQMMARLENVRAPHTIISSNTSGLPIAEIGAECSLEFRRHFLGTHFFNPPRYMKLLELIPTPDTAPEVLAFMHQFMERKLGKGVVLAKDTPNFIANRIGVFSMASILPWVFDGKMSIEDVDALTGTLSGYSKAATFRTADMVGLDVFAYVASNIAPHIPHDEQKAAFTLPKGFMELVKAGATGNKSGQGFYKKERTKTGTTFLVADLASGGYREQSPTTFESVEAAKAIKSPAEKLRFLVQQEDTAGSFLWNVHADLFLYAANRIPEIADSPESIDRAMKWGFNWEMGPFEKWDAIGVPYVVERLQKEGKTVPKHVLDMLSSGRTAFYDLEAGTVYNLAEAKAVPLSKPAEGAIMIEALKKEQKTVYVGKDGSLYDMGDGVALFEFTSKANSLSSALIQSLHESMDRVSRDFDALVIGNEGTNFTVGANLMEVLGGMKSGQRSMVEQAVAQFQQTSLRLRYAPFPVIVAPHQKNFGGGTEFMLHADKVVAHHELYSGLVEVGVGLIPGGAGTKEMLKRALAQVPNEKNADPMLYLKKAFEVIGMAKVSMSAHEARDLGFLRETDIIVMNRDLQLAEAKREARNMADQGYVPPVPEPITLLGQTAYSALKLAIYMMSEARFITPYDALIAEKIARVLTGGPLSEPQEVSEATVLKLEQQAFMELLDDERTLARIEHMLTTGKPLRN